MFIIGTSVSTILYFCSGSSAIISIICSAILTGAMHGVSSMLTAMVPPYFKKYGNVSTVTGVLNACAYIGSGISTFGIAIISESFGWQMNLFTWCIIAVLGTIICLTCIKTWKRKFQ
jgi:OPA family glycerol-3-phosphate transporter-like MFS transporter